MEWPRAERRSRAEEGTTDAGAADRNTASRDRGRRLVERLSEEQLCRPIDGAWTGAALLAHTAFWDHFARERWLLAQRSGSRTPASIDDEVLDLVNDAALPGWLAVPPRDAAEICLLSAEETDRFVASLDDDVVSAVIEEGRERLVERWLLRGEHLDTIESAFPSP